MDADKDADNDADFGALKSLKGSKGYRFMKAHSVARGWRDLTSLAVSGSMFLSSTFVSGSQARAAGSLAERPPQFVLLAFDGSKSITMWNQTRQFAKDMEAEGKHARFTYFVNAAYYVGEKEDRRMTYAKPFFSEHRQQTVRVNGLSAIGWGGGRTDIQNRFDQTNLARGEGHEIASHAVGHFDAAAAQWTEADWHDEFQQFNDFIFTDFGRPNTFLQPTRQFREWTFSSFDIVGFRAPQLGHNVGLWPTLRDNNFRYDTSRVGRLDEWPAKDGYGFWQFPLGNIPIVKTFEAERILTDRGGITRPVNISSTLSMDYNFKVAQGLMYLGNAEAGFSDEDGKLSQMSERDRRLVEIMEEEMLQSYQKYFDRNYYGNRAPVHIGHHFSRWNQGAYWRAFKRFAQSVCGMPEVRCVTYRELADFMDEVDRAPGLRAAYQAGRFEKFSTTPVAASAAEKVYDVNVKLNVQDNGQIRPELIGADAEQITQQIGRRQMRQEFLVNGYAVARHWAARGTAREAARDVRSISINEVRNQVSIGSDAELTVRVVGPDKEEIHRSTFEIKEVGTPFERISDISIEQQLNVFDPPEAHEN